MCQFMLLWQPYGLIISVEQSGLEDFYEVDEQKREVEKPEIINSKARTSDARCSDVNNNYLGRNFYRN